MVDKSQELEKECMSWSFGGIRAVWLVTVAIYIFSNLWSNCDLTNPQKGTGQGVREQGGSLWSQTEEERMTVTGCKCPAETGWLVQAEAEKVTCKREQGCVFWKRRKQQIRWSGEEEYSGKSHQSIPSQCSRRKTSTKDGRNLGADVLRSPNKSLLGWRKGWGDCAMAPLGPGSTNCLYSPKVSNMGT